MTDVIALADTEAVLAALSRGIVALPTDTVYGVGARLIDHVATSALFSLKGRPDGLALPVLVSSIAQIEALGVNVSSSLTKLAEAFWPGPLTVVVRAPHELAQRVGSVTDTVGFRSPNDDELRHVIDRSGPLAVTSANRHGATPCHSAKDVAQAFAGDARLVAIVDGGRRDGAVSTVVDVSEELWQIRRQGAISESELAAVLGSPAAQ